ncbi:MAG: glycosyltransferase [Proteobacteria bacterium]|nr:MAG: glycosyltransferase [Pseudomonadota bacterium]
MTNNSSEPLVGIALAAYKPNIDYFVSQLNSIVNQTYANWFCRIGFDSPLAETLDDPKLAIFKQDPRFRFFQNDHQLGATKNFEAAARVCLQEQPDFIAFSDQDDVWHANKIELQVAELKHRPSLSLVHCDMWILMKTPNGYVKLDETAWIAERRGVHNVKPLDFMIRNVAAGAGMLLDAKLVKQYGDIPDDCFGHDHWFAMAAAFNGGVYGMPAPLYDYRIHGANIAGLSRYSSFFGSSATSKKFGTFKKCIYAYNSSAARYSSAAKDFDTNTVQWLTAKTKIDLGTSYLLKAIADYAKDPALARACLARAVGKCLSLIFFRYKSYSAT